LKTAIFGGGEKGKKNMKTAGADRNFVGFRPAPDVAILLEKAMLATGGERITDIVQDCIRGCLLSVVEAYRKDKLPGRLAQMEQAAADLAVYEPSAEERNARSEIAKIKRKKP
jgi:hypothetical protein